MTIRYMDDGKIPLYECNQLHKRLGDFFFNYLGCYVIYTAVAGAFLERGIAAMVAASRMSPRKAPS